MAERNKHLRVQDVLVQKRKMSDGNLWNGFGSLHTFFRLIQAEKNKVSFLSKLTLSSGGLEWTRTTDLPLIRRVL